MRAAGGLPCLGGPQPRAGASRASVRTSRPKIVARIGRNYAERKFCEIEGPIPTRIGLRWPSILRLQSRFIFGNKRTNLIGHAQKFQPLLFI